MIAVSGLAKRFGPLRVLDALDLHVRRGRVTAVVGPNGSGKTTLIKSILGLATPDAGEIRVDGRPVAAGCDYRAHVGYMPQIARFPENLCAAELLAMLTSLRGAPVGGFDEELDDLFGIAPHLRKPLRTLSGGTRQKVNAMIAFRFRPSLLILDEPTAGMDPVASGVLKDKILRERADGRTFVLTSHIMSELEELADDVVFLLDGRARFAGSVEELKLRTGQTRLERAIARVMVRGVPGEAAA